MSRRKKEASNKYWRAYGDHVMCALGHPEFLFGGGGEGANPDDIYHLCWILKTILLKSCQNLRVDILLQYRKN
jgi:hypothetical protein